MLMNLLAKANIELVVVVARGYMSMRNTNRYLEAKAFKVNKIKSIVIRYFINKAAIIAMYISSSCSAILSVSTWHVLL